MTYSGRPPIYIMYSLLVVMPFSSNFNKFFQFLIPITLVMISLLRFHLTLSSHQIEYKITIANIMIYKKILTSEKIKKVKFGRIGWTTKNAVVKVRRGFNIGVAYFYSGQLIAELEDFALANHIEIQKTRDFLLLEKYYTNS
ncbi:hypothetical protein QNH36_05675 [Mesobacillus sp. AQ2]|jgi:hypothetical protein|uniref:hypothetical protein n=1 Tax=Bacillaceae TaxID=186817 RepID=UPI0011A8AAB3|nr:MULTISPECIES: hypothetical protein [Bacillaceae]WHX41644.1 hypothetical protein QNH36_05675 [Mesobacillus sp. AQ2]